MDYFNSQPHKEADIASTTSLGITDISTHSLTRRLTADGVIGPNTWYISTHSLTRRLTLQDMRTQVCNDISTHSLTRRLT